MLSKLTTSAILGASKVQEHLTATLFPTVSPVTDSTPNLSYPGDNCCTFFEDSNYGGSTQKVCLTSTGEQDFHFDAFNDKTSSFWCGKDIAYDICKNQIEDSCTQGNGISGAGSVRSAQVGHNDSATTIKLRPYDASKQGAVVLFADNDCKGDMGRFYAPVSTTEKQYYTQDEMWTRNMGHDKVDSLMVPFGYSVDLYADDGFSGAVKTVQGPLFIDEHLGMSCININGDFHDKTDSLAVYKNTVLGSSMGYWTSITATESLKFKTHYGLSYSHSESTSETSQFTLSYEMTTSIKYEVASASETVKESYQQTIQRDTESAYSQDYSVDIELTCTAKGSGGVGLWQYVQESTDGKSKVMTLHTVCRYEDLYNKSPACPWNACSNADCSTCATDWKA